MRTANQLRSSNQISLERNTSRHGLSTGAFKKSAYGREEMPNSPNSLPPHYSKFQSHSNIQPSETAHQEQPTATEHIQFMQTQLLQMQMHLQQMHMRFSKEKTMD